MPLFGSNKRDARFSAHLSREVMRRIISIQIELYKLSLNHTELTLYNESSQRVYNNPIKLYSLISKEDMTSQDVDMGLNISQNVVFSFLRDDLKCNNIIIDIGDVIKFDDKYYEIDNIGQTQYWFGRNDETLLDNHQTQFGYNISVKCSAHLTRLASIQLQSTFIGINPINNKPKNI